MNYNNVAIIICAVYIILMNIIVINRRPSEPYVNTDPNCPTKYGCRNGWVCGPCYKQQYKIQEYQRKIDELKNQRN